METLNTKDSYTTKIEVKTTADKALQSVGKVGQWWAQEKDGLTTLTMTHVGLVPGVECYEMCSNGWNGQRKALTKSPDKILMI